MKTDSHAAKERAAKLRKEINHYRYLYHVLNRQEISDAALDSLKHELTKIEAAFPALITPDSPTQRVAGKALPGFKKVRHALPLLSLGDVFSKGELTDWSERIDKLAESGSAKKIIEYFAEIKVDGFAISLEYVDGVLKTGSTRGDGKIGEDVTENLKTINSIPLRLTAPHEFAKEREVQKILRAHPSIKKLLEPMPRHLEVRGEVYMTKQAFEKVNRAQEKKGLPLFANPRNISAGSVRQLDPQITARRMLSFLAYDVVTDIGQTTHEESHAIATLLGFETMKLARACRSLEDITRFWRQVLDTRDSLPLLIDGIVVQVNNIDLFKRIGVAGKAPRGAIAFKFPAVEATTVVKKIIVQVGRTGVLTPVAILEPVSIAGVTVSRATLHNMDEIERLDVREGDTVVVKRAGDVIPDVVKVLKNLRPAASKAFHMPRAYCGQHVVRKEGEVAHRIAHPDKCELVTREKFYHLVSRGAFDIRGLGPKIIDHLLDEGIVQDPADLFTLEARDLESLERFAEKSAENLIRAIRSRRHPELARFIYALGIMHVGEETALDLATHFGTLLKLANASQEDLEAIPQIGSVVARSIHKWFDDVANKAFIHKLTRAGVEPAKSVTGASGGRLKGLSFVLTGGLQTMTRDEAKARIRAFGGDSTESVSKKTDFVIAGNDPGSKRQDAEKLGVKIISEKEFLTMLK